MRSATLFPSRAPSTTKSVIRATASGWFSFTPRARRLRATSAAMATSSLSFSRGVRFISDAPDPGQGRAVAQDLQRRQQDLAQGEAVGRGDTGEVLAVEGAG